MRLWRRLDVRLFASYALVALVVFGAFAITVRVDRAGPLRRRRQDDHG